MTKRKLRAVTAGVAGAGLLVAFSGCSMTMRDLPLPGTGVSGETIEVKAEFDEALNLAEGAPVKVNGVDSGKVTSITVEDFTAEVTMDIRTDAELHEGATARLRYTTPLGELFIDVTNPPKGEELSDGAELDLTQTDTAPTVEDALAQASLLVNGGGLDQLQTITEELNTAIGGNEEDIRLLLSQASTFLTEANATTASIDTVLTSLDSLSGTLSDREAVINRAMRDIRPAARVLRRATPELTALLEAVERFASAANNTVTATRSQLLALLGEAEPVLAELASNRGRFDEMLHSLAVAAEAIDEAIPGDWGTLLVDVHLDGIQTGNLGGLDNLLDILDITAPLGDVIDQLGPGAPGDRDGAGPTNQLSLDGLLSGLLGGGA